MCPVFFYFITFPLAAAACRFFRVILSELTDLQQPQVVPKFLFFPRLAAAASRAICRLATVASRILADLRLPQVENK